MPKILSCARVAVALLLVGSISTLLFAQSVAPFPTPDRIIEKAYPSVALILSSQQAGQLGETLGTGIVVRANGVLLTAYHVVKNAYSLQVRFKSGEVFDQVQLLGVDERRDVAALKITARGLPVLPLSPPDSAKPGDPITVISHAAALPWSASAGVVAAYRLADEVPGAGAGYRLLQFTAPTSPGSSGGLLMDSQGNALGVIVGSLKTGQNLNFAVPIESVLGLADAPASKAFADGSQLKPPDITISSAPVPPSPVSRNQPALEAKPENAEKSDLLSSSKDRDFILRNSKTMFVQARGAQYFESDQLKAALGRNKDFAKLNIRIVDDPKVADTVLEVGYTFAWDFPFELRHQNTTTVLLAGKGVGPFSGPAGASSVASEFVKAAKPFRAPKLQK